MVRGEWSLDEEMGGIARVLQEIEGGGLETGAGKSPE